LAKEQHQQNAGGGNCSENDKQQSPCLGRNICLIGKQEIYNEISKQQTDKTSTAENTFTTPNIYNNTQASLNFTASNYNKKLSCHRGTARRAMSVETCSPAALLYEKHIKSPIKSVIKCIVIIVAQCFGGIFW